MFPENPKAASPLPGACVAECAAPTGAAPGFFGATLLSPAFAGVTSLPAGVSTGRSIAPNSETLAFPYLILLYTANVLLLLSRSRLVIREP